MSASMIRRGLELLSDDIKDAVGGRKSKRKLKPGERSDKKDQISSNKQGVTKQLRRLRGRPGSAKNRATVKDKKVKSAVEEFLKTQKSHLRENLAYFRGTEYRPTQSDTAKILLQNKSRQSRHRPDVPAKKPKEKMSLFTEEEFQQFQLQYFGRKVEDNK
ncbi:ribosomal protein S19 binding protein 1 [Brienomyrus brachyistius]|uniref:ribosomal protein S19 binding protein 1 n=1 Tax=Brienomyrus brachyistius TaxID=42636 RepID=UPI0020B3174B|nr:ribosomal protein S19 binding protein 1 [Brienomyrus brachyistius]